MAESSASLRVPLNPLMLRWARELSGKTIDDAAKRVRKNPTDIEAWESDSVGSQPTVKQARALATFYGRSFLELLRPSPPDLYQPKTIPDFRSSRDKTSPEEDKILEEVHLWAEIQRQNALDLYSLNGEVPPEFPQSLRGDLESDPETVAEQCRAAIGFEIEDQVGLKKADKQKLPLLIRERLESAGLLTLRSSSLKKAKKFGICLAEYPLPTIVFANTSPAHQSFTLSHEFGHVVLGQSAIVGPLRKSGYEPSVERIERWCNRFAGAFLIPKSFLIQWLDRPTTPLAEISDSVLEDLADALRISQHAMLVRLVELGYVQADYYWNIKRQEFDNQESKYKSFGRAKYFGSRYRNELGDHYTGLVLSAWGSGKITNHNAAEFMGIKRLAHMNDIRSEFYG